MGSGESVRATQFHNYTNNRREEKPDEENASHISISTKMVERLVEDAALAPKKETKGDRLHKMYDNKDKLLLEKLKSLDDTHSERTGLTAEEVEAVAGRVAMRTSYFGDCEPVCEAQANKVVECYLSVPDRNDASRCAHVVGEFKKCVQTKATARLHAHASREAIDSERRSRDSTRGGEISLVDFYNSPSGNT